MGRVVAQAGLPELVATARAAGERIVFTNGHFDLLHVGHLRYLRAARALGDRLIVAVNGDASTTRLKGSGRPLVAALERAELLAALEPVDWVTIFEEDSPAALLTALRPESYVKGADYAAVPGEAGKPLAEAAVVRAYGGLVSTIPLVPERSTSDLIARIVASARQAER